MTAQDHALKLDADSLDPAELSIPALMRELTQQQRPSRVLRLLMNHLEGRRQAKGLGWSRPWNKIGLTVFRTHKQEPGADADYLLPFVHVLDLLLGTATEATRAFARDLIQDPKLMVFTFYHNREEAGIQYEGVTISFGRKVPNDASKRDRIDLILEDQRTEGRVDGNVDLARLYVCPWSSYESGRQHVKLTWARGIDALPAQFDVLYPHAIEFYHRWKSDESRQWGHWASSYIDYFGARAFIPQGTSFF